MIDYYYVHIKGTPVGKIDITLDHESLLLCLKNEGYMRTRSSSSVIELTHPETIDFNADTLVIFNHAKTFCQIFTLPDVVVPVD